MRSIGRGITSGAAVPPGFAVAGPSLRMDCCGMRCPQPVLRLAIESAEIPAGTIIEIVGDCATFEEDVRVFCERRKKMVLAVRTEGEATAIWIRC